MSRTKVFVVEDDLDMLENIRDILDMNGYEVHTNPGSHSAMQEIEAKRPDIVVLGWLLPNRDGLQIIQEIRARSENKSIPCLMLTARSRSEDMVMGYQHGVDVYLTKPFDTTVLMAIIRQMERRITNYIPYEQEYFYNNYNSRVPFVKRFLDLVAEYYSDAKIKLADYARHLYCSQSSLNAKIKTYTGVSPYAIILEYRLFMAQHMLREHRANVTEVAYSCGFTSLSGFSIAYKKKYGYSPKDTNITP